MTRALPILILALGAACVDGPRERDGTFVGNPGKMDVGLGALPEGIALDAADFLADSVHLEACDGTGVLVPLGPFDALGGREDAVEIPGGEFCRLTLNPAPVQPLFLAGSTAAGTAFTAVIDPGVLVLDGVVRVDGTELLWELALDGLDPAAIDALGPGAAIGPQDPIAVQTAEGLAADLALWEDVDADGQIGQPDHLLGTADPAQGTTAGGLASADEAGCGCASAPAAPLPWFPLWWWAWTRRRPRARA